MPEVEPIKISDAEWEVMRVIWTKEKVTSPEIVNVLEMTMDWKPATIKTLIGRLVKKGCVSTEKVGKGFVYRSLVSERETVKSATESLFSHICAKKVGVTIGDLIRQAELTQEDLALIQKEISNKQAVAKIACNCIPGQCECQEHGCNSK